MVISICIVLTLTLSIVEPDVFATYILRYAHFNKYVGYARICLYPFQHACASGDSRLRQLVEDVASSQCKCTAFFTTITSTKFASPHIWFEDYTFRTLSEAVHWTAPRRISFCIFSATSSVDNGSGEVCRFTRLLFAGAETRIMAGQLGRRCILYLTATLCWYKILHVGLAPARKTWC